MFNFFKDIDFSTFFIKTLYLSLFFLVFIYFLITSFYSIQSIKKFKKFRNFQTVNVKYENIFIDKFQYKLFKVTLNNHNYFIIGKVFDSKYL